MTPRWGIDDAAGRGADSRIVNCIHAHSRGALGDYRVLIEICKLNDIDPQSYLTDVITRIVNDHPNSRSDELLPWTYAAAPALKNVA